MSHDTWLHRLARLFVKPLVRTPVTPNQLTTLRLLSGLGAAGLLAVGTDPWVRYGAALFLISMVLDRADGDLARLSGKISPWGHTYDLISDCVCNAAVFVGIGVGLRAGKFGWWSASMGLLAGLAVTAILWLVMTIESVEGQRGAELGNLGGFDADDAMLIVPIAVLLGMSEFLIMAASVGAPLFCAFMFWQFRAKLRHAGS